MKNLLTIIMSICIVQAQAQLTYVPDDVFEDLLESTYPSCSNGVANDDYVLTAGLQDVTSFGCWGCNVSDFTGIEDCDNLTGIAISLNHTVTSIDLSGVNRLNGQVTELLVYITGNNNLTSLTLPDTVIYCNISSNPLLTSIEINGVNTEFGTTTTTGFGVNNQIAILDLRLAKVSNNAVIAITGNPSLTCVLLDNGYCTSWGGVEFIGNSQLNCVQVDDPVYSENSPIWSWNEQTLDPSTHTYSTNCNCGPVGIDEYNMTANKQVVAIYDLLGRETILKQGEVQIYLYSDGSREKVFVARD